MFNVNCDFDEGLCNLCYVNLSMIIFKNYIGFWMMCQVLKPGTRQKLRIEGQAYLKVLSEFFQSVPAFLGGSCTCPKCGMLLSGKRRRQTLEEMRKQEISDDALHFELSPYDFEVTDLVSCSCEHLRATVIGILMLCIIVAFLAGTYDPYSSVAL